MRKTTVYLPEKLKRRVGDMAALDGVSESSFIRAALDRALRDRDSPRPRLGMFASRGDPTLAEHVDEHLSGFGER